LLALEAGVEFIAENDDAHGVRLKPARASQKRRSDGETSKAMGFD